MRRICQFKKCTESVTTVGCEERRDMSIKKYIHRAVNHSGIDSYATKI